MKLTDRDRKTAEELENRLPACNGSRIRRVILYGSRAHGTPAPESDFDLLVIEADPLSKRVEMRRLREAGRGTAASVHVWVKGEEECEETKNVIGGIAYPAHKYGVVLFENA